MSAASLSGVSTGGAVSYEIRGMPKPAAGYIVMTLFFVLITPLSASGGEKGQSPPYRGGAQALLCNRHGSYLLSAIEKRLDTTRGDLAQFGFFLGRRVAHGEYVRLELTASASFGNADEGLLHAQDNNAYEIRHYMRQLGLEFETHIFLPPVERMRMFIRLGAGVVHTHFQERFFRADNPEQQVIISNDAFAYESKKWSPEAMAGLGIDIGVRDDLGVGFTYGFSVSRPVAYEDTRNMPLGLDYRELHLSHTFRLSALFAIESL